MADTPSGTPRLDQLEAEMFRLLVEGITDYAIFLLDPDGLVASWNAGAARVKGYQAHEIIGRHFSIFYPDDAIARDWPATELRFAKEQGRFEDEGWRVRKDGSRFWADVVITAVYDTQGRHRGFSKITRDLTERRRHELALAQSEERVRLLVDSVQDYAILRLEPDGTIASWNAGAAAITGYTAAEAIGRHFSMFYPEDALARDWPAHVLEVAGTTGRFQEEGVRVRKDGTHFWADILVTALRGPEGLLGFAKVTRDLTQHRRVRALEESERRSQQFLAMLAHELRNPLAPIQNALNIMSMSEVADPTVRWAREVIDRHVLHITRLVDDLLDISRLTTGKIGIRVRLLDLRDVVAQSVEGARVAFEARKQRFNLLQPDEPLPVSGDLTRLVQVVNNLLSNASKYTPEGGVVDITTSGGPQDVEIRIRDNGAGIPAELLPRVFDLFVQSERDLARTEGGLGIGLTLVRQLVQLHGGSVEGRSEGPGTGSEFIVRLPRAAVSDSEWQNRGPAFADTESEPGHRVLIVDDNRDSADTMAQILEMWGFRTRCAYEGRSAYQLAREWRPDTILLDLGLPEMDGYEVMQRLQEEGHLQETVVAAMTGYGTEDDKNRTRAAGFAGHLVKPVNLADLRTLLKRTRRQA